MARRRAEVAREGHDVEFVFYLLGTVFIDIDNEHRDALHLAQPRPLVGVEELETQRLDRQRVNDPQAGGEHQQPDAQDPACPGGSRSELARSLCRTVRPVPELPAELLERQAEVHRQRG